MSSWMSPIRILMIYLIGMAVFASWSWGGLEFIFWLGQIRNLVLLSAGSWGCYYLLLYSQKIKPTRWEHHLITSLILFLLFDPLIAWWLFFSAGVITEGSSKDKHLAVDA